ncbi:hypothetical protein VTN77DRAFT_7864 [Rasamsonia byssochlamydoides]|uniref:uncharacterized protein n=1 Tax=Rasamsonia byssochlamydoides TaxID=89139 RepID=UPI003743A6AE
MICPGGFIKISPTSDGCSMEENSPGITSPSRFRAARGDVRRGVCCCEVESSRSAAVVVGNPEGEQNGMIRRIGVGPELRQSTGTARASARGASIKVCDSACNLDSAVPGCAHLCRMCSPPVRMTMLRARTDEGEGVLWSPPGLKDHGIGTLQTAGVDSYYRFSSSPAWVIIRPCRDSVIALSSRHDIRSNSLDPIESAILFSIYLPPASEHEQSDRDVAWIKGA